MAKRFRRDQICEDYSQEEWNSLYSEAEAGERSGVIGEWNDCYSDASDADVQDFNEMYAKVEIGEGADVPGVEEWNEEANR